jgi:hypothetical protein
LAEIQRASDRRSLNSSTKSPKQTLAQGNSRQPFHRAPNTRKPGRSPKLPQAFVVCAGMQWRKAISDSHTKASDDQLRRIASALDAAAICRPLCTSKANMHKN